MGLIRPNGPSWAYCSHNLPSTPSLTSVGTQVTPGTSNADGTAVTALSALAHDVEYLKIWIAGDGSASGLNTDILLNVLVDPAGGTSWSPLIPWLIAGTLSDSTASLSTTPGGAGHYDFPLWIPAGASIGLQARGAGATTIGLKVVLLAYGGNANPASWWCGQRVKDIGIVSASSTGTAHLAGASGSYSSWTDLGSALDDACGALQFAVNGEGDGTMTTGSYQFELGADGERIGAPMFRLISSSENGWWVPTGPIFRKLAAGTQLQIRAKCNGAGGAGTAPQNVGVAAWTVH
jgi:hypothetical protein